MTPQLVFVTIFGGAYAIATIAGLITHFIFRGIDTRDLYMSGSKVADVLLTFVPIWGIAQLLFFWTEIGDRKEEAFRRVNKVLKCSSCEVFSRVHTCKTDSDGREMCPHCSGRMSSQSVVNINTNIESSPMMSKMDALRWGDNKHNYSNSSFNKEQEEKIRRARAKNFTNEG